MNAMRQNGRLLWTEYRTSVPLSQNVTAPNSTSLYGNAATFSSDMAPNKGTYTFLMVLLLFFIFTCCAEQLFGRRNPPDDGTQGVDHTGAPKKSRSKRTQEAIMKMLLIKKVTVLSSPTTIDIEKGMVTSRHGDPDERRARVTLERRKSNLVIPSNATTDDALDASRTCSICLCEYEHGDGICYSRNEQCVHRFHTNCAVAWFAKHEECPICRAQYLVELSTPTPKEGELLEEGAIRPSSDSPCPHHTPSTTPTAAFMLPRSPIIVVEEEEEGDIESNFSSMPELLPITEDDILHIDSSSLHQTDEDHETVEDTDIAHRSTVVSRTCPSVTSCSADTTDEESEETAMQSYPRGCCDPSSMGRTDSTTRKNTDDDMHLPENTVMGPETV